MRPRAGGLVDYRGGCYTCSAAWFSKNVMGIAARHAAANPEHQVWCEMGYSYSWGPK